MTVKRLIDLLSKLPPESLVVLARDSDGNGYQPLVAVAGDMVYRDFDVGFAELTDKLKRQGYGEGDLIKGGKRAVVLWP